MYLETLKMVDNLMIYDLGSKSIPKSIPGQERVKGLWIERGPNICMIRS